MELNILANSLGLIFDIIWAILLFKYWLPEELSKIWTIRLSVWIDEKEKIKAQKYDFWWKIWLLLLILWFILQLLSNFIPNS